jgi:hypothetical protein
MNRTNSTSSNELFWAGVAVAVGSFGVVLASIFYALSPVAAALPIPGVALEKALSGMITGRSTMVAAGVTGVISDVILIAGMLSRMASRKPTNLQFENLGWALAAIGVVIFIVVDSLSAGVLTQIAALDESMPVLAGFKLMFDIFFIFGTITVSLGTLAILVREIKAKSPILSKPLAWAGILVSLIGLISSLLYFANIALPQVIGISIAGVSLIFGIYGIQLARSKE